ncbi:acetyl-CoA carboxylase biotin carboxyl carrier protein [Tundrisphaera lichenicola]|uniref:acetyl-CoA carboxylase biotin carboxyl carrier protein n=1 Tax=Tundrisphaera lichenicola TaxID=2029860 RepID=UPI003EBDA768
MPELEKNAESPEPDVRAIHQLVRLMKRYDLTAIDFIEGPTQIRLRRRGPEVALPMAYPPPNNYAPAANPASAVDGPTIAMPATPVAAPAPAAPSGLLIESPMVGTFYSSSSPEAPPFVTVGSAVRPDLTVCIIEAMKVFTDIPAGLSGTITEVLVKSGQPVEFGQPLFRVSPA